MKEFLPYLAFMIAWILLPGPIVVAITRGWHAGIGVLFGFWQIWVITLWAACLMYGESTNPERQEERDGK